MYKHRLARRLGLSQKKVKKRLDDIQMRYGIVETNVQDGKQVLVLELLSKPLTPRLTLLQSAHVGRVLSVRFGEQSLGKMAPSPHSAKDLLAFKTSISCRW